MNWADHVSCRRNAPRGCPCTIFTFESYGDSTAYRVSVAGVEFAMAVEAIYGNEDK